jgi:hypothetical protein
MSTAESVQNAALVVCDDDGRNATLAGAALGEKYATH